MTRLDELETKFWIVAQSLENLHQRMDIIENTFSEKQRKLWEDLLISHRFKKYESYNYIEKNKKNQKGDLKDD